MRNFRIFEEVYMKIFTSYFAMTRYFSDDLIPVSISRFAPPGYKGLAMPELAPSRELLAKYKQDKDESAYTKEYNEQLARLDATGILHKLEFMTKGKDCVLLCYEKTSNFCHRHLVADWLNQNGCDVQEWTKTTEA